MKKNIIIIILLLCLAYTIGQKPEYTARGGVVVDLNRDNDIVTVEDCVGFLWEFSGCEDWYLGDGCVMIMNTKHTQSILDDEIVTVHYERIDLLNEISKEY